MQMNAWIEVVRDPLGLAAFALALLFSLLGAYFKLRKSPSLVAFRMACVAAIVAVAGGVTIGVLKATASAEQTLPTSRVEQTTEGSGSPAIANTQGDVNVTIKPAGTH